MSTQVKLIVFKSDDGINWSPMLPADVPAWVKEEQTVVRLVNGEMAQAPGELTCYAALRHEDAPPVEEQH